MRLETKLNTSKWGDEHLFFRHGGMGRDRNYWTRDLRKLKEDPWFDRNDQAEIWGTKVPDTWPSDREEAEEKFVD